ncbi:MAG: YdcF family protein [Defluviitaleaceae bacterium]|nr:YdcF family protein [Defluviitaleaceae bacterium]
MRKILFVASILSAIATFRWAFVSGPTNNNTIFMAGITAALGIYGWFYDRFKKMRWLTITLATLIVSVLGFSAFIGVYGRRSTADYTEDVVIVLGGGIRFGEVRPTLQRRLDQALAYHQRNPHAMILVTGGSGYGEVISEAEAMARYLIRNGVPQGQILLEEEATSTYTNMSFSREILDAHFNTPPRAVVVTSDFHMFRSARFAQRLGIEATIYPASTPWLGAPFYYVREVAAVIKMWVIGR